MDGEAEDAVRAGWGCEVLVVAGQGTPRVENPAWEEGLSLLGIRSLSIYGRHACLAGVGELPALSPLPIGQTASLPFRVFLAAVRGPASEFWLGAHRPQ